MAQMKKGKADTFPITLATTVPGTKDHTVREYQIPWGESSLQLVSQSACLNIAHCGLVEPNEKYHGPVSSAILEFKVEHIEGHHNDLLQKISETLDCNAVGWFMKVDRKKHPDDGPGSILTVLVPFSSPISDPRTYRGICRWIEFKVNLAENYGVIRQGLRFQGHTSPITMTDGRGYLDVEKVQALIPAPDKRDSLSGETIVEFVEGGRFPLKSLKTGEKFTCPVCQPHPFRVGSHSVFLEEDEDRGIWFHCPQCQILGNGFHGQFDLELDPMTAETASTS